MRARTLSAEAAGAGLFAAIDLNPGVHLHKDEQERRSSERHAAPQLRSWLCDARWPAKVMLMVQGTNRA